MPDESLPESIGGWSLLREIGRGGQGIVFETKRGESEELSALKLVKATAKQSQKRQRFLSEINAHRALAEEGCKNIIRILDCSKEFSSDDLAFMVMPKANSSLQKAGKAFVLRVELTLEVFMGILNGIETAHAKGILHRDIKPANILFLDEHLRHPVVSDFGINLLKDLPRDERLTEVGETVGAQFYRAPEQEEPGQQAITESADIYALGKVLHFMLTQRTIYREELGDAFKDDELSADNRIKSIRSRLLDRMIVRDSSARFQNISDVREEVERILK